MEQLSRHFSFKSFLKILLVVCCTLAMPSQIGAQPVISLTPVISTGLDLPIQFVNAGDGSNRVFIVQKGGVIKVYDAAFNYLSDFLTVSPIDATGERGLLSMAFHPDYNSNGFFYVYYTNSSGDLEVARYHVSSGNVNVADPASKVVVITIPHPTNNNHNGGELHFGADGYLYLSTGDGGGAGDVPNNAQNTAVLLGKILRFNVNTSATAPYYTIPPGNPYANEIYALGLRNPYRWSFDRLTNDMWIGDVGQDSWEEVDFSPAAATANVNYGWRCYEGDSTFNTAGCASASNYTFPVFSYPSQNPSASVTGGVVYRGTVSPLLQGYYMAADFYSGVFYLIAPDGSGGWNTSTQTVTPTGIVDFGETENGEVYAVSLTGNSVFNVSASTILPVQLVSFTADAEQDGVLLSWKTAREDDLQQFEIEYSTDGSAFRHLSTIEPRHAAQENVYDYFHEVAFNGSIFYRLKMLKANGDYGYSTVLQVKLNNATGGIIRPNLISDGQLLLHIEEDRAYRSFELLSMEGRVLLTKGIATDAGVIAIDVSFVAPGMYLAKINNATTSFIEKVFIQ